MATLRQYRRRTALTAIDLSQVPVSRAVESLKKVEKGLSDSADSMVCPEHEALHFYLQNAAYAQVIQRVHPDAQLSMLEPLVESYQRTVQSKSLRLFYYLLLICTRESRHTSFKPALYDELLHRHGVRCLNFTKSIGSSGSTSAVAAFRAHPPEVNMGVYTAYLFDVFDLGADHGCFVGGFGGKPWANVSKVLRDFVHGRMSAELMLDQGFALAHNNGPIFNKQVFYYTYDIKEFMKILDVQRAGMIPQLVCSGGSSYVTQDHLDYWTAAAALLGESFHGEVDWYKVEALGAVQKYVKQKPKVASPAPPQLNKVMTLLGKSASIDTRTA